MPAFDPFVQLSIGGYKVVEKESHFRATLVVYKCNPSSNSFICVDSGTIWAFEGKSAKSVGVKRLPPPVFGLLYAKMNGVLPSR